MIIGLMAGWVLTGLVLAMLVGRAVRTAEARGDRTLESRASDVQPVEAEVARAA